MESVHKKTDFSGLCFFTGFVLLEIRQLSIAV